jgi:hypothetical protein
MAVRYNIGVGWEHEKEELPYRRDFGVWGAQWIAKLGGAAHKNKLLVMKTVDTVYGKPANSKYKNGIYADYLRNFSWQYYRRMGKAESVLFIKCGGETDSVVLDFKVGNCIN